MNVIITGASRGIGAELVKLFAAGKDNIIIALSRNLVQLENIRKDCLLNHPGVSIFIYQTDLTAIDTEHGSLVSFIEHHMDHIDILVNNAGYLVNKPFTDICSSEMEQMVKVNYTGPARLIQLLIERMGGDTPSHIVNIGSMGGFQGSAKYPGLAIYSSTKAALASLTECLAEELKGRNIYFNCLALGAVSTEMFEEAFPGFDASLSAGAMAQFIHYFSVNGYRYFNGKVIPVSLGLP